jgi:hypothetical protein
MVTTTLYRYPHRGTSLAIDARCTECERSRDNALIAVTDLPATKVTGTAHEMATTPNKAPIASRALFPVFDAGRLPSTFFVQRTIL